MKLCDEGVQNLIFAVFSQAIKDYKHLVKAGVRGRALDPNFNKAELEKFFNEDPYYILEDKNITGNDITGYIKEKYSKQRGRK